MIYYMSGRYTRIATAFSFGRSKVRYVYRDDRTGVCYLGSNIPSAERVTELSPGAKVLTQDEVTARSATDGALLWQWV